MPLAFGENNFWSWKHLRSFVEYSIVVQDSSQWHLGRGQRLAAQLIAQKLDPRIALGLSQDFLELCRLLAGRSPTEPRQYAGACLVGVE